MLRFLKLLVVAPIAILLLLFAYANRHFVTVSFDPLASGDASAVVSLTAPLFVVLILSVMVGVVAGGVATWFGQGRHRRLARQLRVECDRLKADLEAAKARTTTIVARRA